MARMSKHMTMPSAFRLKMAAVLCLFYMTTADAQMLLDSSWIYPTHPEQVVYTTNSVQVEACASIANVASSSRGAFQTALSQNIGSILSGSALFLTRVYSDSATGNLCFFYVYQAPNQEAARAAFAKLSPQGVGTSQGVSLTVTFNSLPYVCTVSASVWQNEDSLPFGVQLPFQWSANDILLWAVCGGALLCVAAISACCFILHFSARREIAVLESVVAMDQKLLAKLQSRGSIVKKNTTKEEEDDVKSDDDDNNDHKRTRSKSKSHSTNKK